MEKIESDNLKFIKGFAKIKISHACKLYGYNYSNLIYGKCSRDAERKVRKYLEYELARVRINEVGDTECLEK